MASFVSNSTRDGLQYVSLQHPSGSSTVEVCLYGATVISFSSSLEKDGMQENLFVSEKAHLDGSKPIRGGIPLVFPQFGPGPLPNHGFARTSTWSLAGTSHSPGDDETVCMTLSLTDSEETRKVWPYKFALSYTITLYQSCLVTALSVDNLDEKAFDVQMLLHTYYHVEDLSSFAVNGLSGLSYLDKVLNGGASTLKEERETVGISQEVDRVYLETPNELFISGVSPTRAIALTKKLTKRSPVNEDDAVPQVSVIPCEAVVWNPWVEKAKATSDLGDEEYHNFVCVEPGAVNPASPVACEPGARVTLSQDIHVIGM